MSNTEKKEKKITSCYQCSHYCSGECALGTCPWNVFDNIQYLYDEG